MYKYVRNKIGQFVKVKRVVLTCAQCNKKFEAYPSEIKKGRKFCCTKCFFNSGTKRNRPSIQDVVIICSECGKTFKARPYKNRKFCSKSCASKYNAEKIDRCGENNPTWKG